jgi:hypothetical protein
MEAIVDPLLGEDQSHDLDEGTAWKTEYGDLRHGFLHTAAGFRA